MVNQALTTRPQKDLSLLIGADNFQRHVSNIIWTPATPSQIEWRGGTPDALVTSSIPGSWSASLTVAQDWENPNSLCNFLLANEGEEVAVEYMPHADGAFKIAATLTLAAPAIGGPVNQFNESTVVCASTIPVPTFPAPVIP